MASARTRIGKIGKWATLAAVAILLLATIAAPVAGQGQVDSEGTATGGPGGFTGTVLDTVTGDPVDGALVFAFEDVGGAEAGNGTTDLAGAYSITQANDGTYDLEFSKDDYEVLDVADRTVVAGDTYYLNVSLQPLPSTISGTVTDAQTGDLLPGVDVTLEEGTFMTNQMTVTDAYGMFNFSTLTREYALSFSMMDYVIVPSGSMVAIGPNATVTKDQAMDRQMGTLSGMVTGSGGLADVEVVVEGVMDCSATTNTTGHYTVQAYWGDYSLSVVNDGYYYYTDDVTISAGSVTTQDIALVKTPPRNAKAFGYVKGNDTKMPLDGAEVLFVDHEAGGSLYMRTGSDGYFMFDIYPGYFEVVVEADGYIGYSSYASVSKNERKNLGDIYLVPTPPLDNKVHGVVSSGGAPVAGAKVMFLDGGVQVGATVTTNVTGHYETMVYDGTFTAKVRADGYFPLDVAGIAVTADVQKDFTLLAMPTKDLRVYGYVKDFEGEPVPMATVTLVDKATDHGGYSMSTITTMGGYYTFDVYAGDFLLIVDAVGYDADLFTLDVDANLAKDVTLDNSAQEGLDTLVMFDIWDNITVKTVMDMYSDVKLVRYQIDSKFGDNNGNVTQAEVDAWLQVEKDKGPDMKDTKEWFGVDSTAYGIVDGTFDVMADRATGLITSAGPITVTKSADFVAVSGIKIEDEHVISFNATFDDEGTDHMATITLPEGWESRNATSEYVAVDGTFDINLDPPMQEPGLEWEIVLLNVTGNSAPLADAGKNRTIKVDVNETFDGSGSDDDFGVVNFTWDFGDGDIGYGEEVVHKFSLPTGKDWWNYTVSLTVRDTAGVTNMTDIWVIVDGAPPVAKFDANKTAADEDGDRIGFNASTSSDNVGVFNYTWDFDDGKFGYGEAVNHTWIQPGEYNVTLNITDKAGWWANHTVTVTIRDVTDPKAKVNYEGPSDKKLYVDDEVLLVFNGSMSTDNVGVVKYKWDFGDGTTIEGADKVEVNHTYKTVNTYNMTLTVWDAAGNMNTSAAMVFEVVEKPKIPDLEIESISISPDGFRDSDTVTIKIKVLNNGDGDITAGEINEDFAVQFSYGKHKIKFKRDLTVAAHSETTVKIEWKAKEGSYKICADADPENKIGETDENNNRKCTAKIEVGMGWSNIGLVVGLVLVLVILVALAAWRSKVAKRERKERLKQRKKR